LDLKTIFKTVSKAKLVNDLMTIGLGKGDIVYVHSSLKRIGFIEDGPETLIDAFLEVLGDEGTLAVPTHSLSYVGLGRPPYEIGSTPTLLGMFPEAVRRHPKALRSAHPTHSTSAIGKDADEITCGHNLSNAMHTDSPLYKIYQKGGKVLLLGVDHRRSTALHLAESLAGVRYLDIHYNDSWSKDAHYIQNGKTKVITQVSFPGCSRRFDLMDSYFQFNDIAKKGKIGNGVSQLLNMKEMIDLTVAMLREKPDFFLCYDEDCPCCGKRRAYMRGFA